MYSFCICVLKIVNLKPNTMNRNFHAWPTSFCQDNGPNSSEKLGFSSELQDKIHGTSDSNEITNLKERGGSCLRKFCHE